VRRQNGRVVFQYAKDHLIFSPLIRKSEPDKTSAAELIESQQGFPVAIPVLHVKREIHIRKLLPEFEFVRIFVYITEYRGFYIQLMVPQAPSPEKVPYAYPDLPLPHIVEECIVAADRSKIGILVGITISRCVPELDIQ